MFWRMLAILVPFAIFSGGFGCSSSVPVTHSDPPPPPDTKALAALWDDLASADAPRAYRAVVALTRFPAQSVPLLAKQLQPAVGITDTEIAKLIASLEADDFDVREQAQQRLAVLGPRARRAMEAALAGKPTAEASRRLTAIRDALPDHVPPADELRAVRAIEVLERLASQEAITVLKRVGSGEANALPTLEANASLDRLRKRP